MYSVGRPRVVVEDTSTMAFRLIPLPHRVVLLGRDEDVNGSCQMRIGGWYDFGGRKCTAQTGNPVMSRYGSRVKGATDLGVTERHFARETDAGNSSTVARIHGSRGGDCRSQLCARLHARITGNCAKNGEPAGVDYIQDMKLFLESLHEAESGVLRECLGDQTWSSL